MQTGTTTVLTPSDHEHFLEHGHVILRGAVPPDAVDSALRALESNENGQQRAAALEACTTDGVLDAIAELFGPGYPFERHRSAADMPRPYNPAGVDSWRPEGGHHDQSYPTLIADIAAIRVFIFLSKVNSRGGAFMYSPGSHAVYREIMQRGPTTHPWGEGPWVRARAGAREPAPQPLQELLAEPGDVLLYHVHLSHSGSDNVADPQTRHALTSSYAPTRRIDPGNKSLDEMSTFEKSCSIRWLQHRFGPQFLAYPVTRSADAKRALAEGFRRDADVVAHVETRYAGRQHRWYVDTGDPSLVRHAVSEDWITWTEATPVRVDAPAATSLHPLALQDQVFMTVVAPDATTIFRTTDYETWTPLSMVAGVTGTCLFPNADGLHLFGPDRSQPTNVGRLSGGGDSSDLTGRGAEDLATWNDRGIAATVPGTVVGAVVFQISAGEFAMIVEVEACGPHCARSKDGITYDSEAQPLAFDAPSTPRDIRLYEHAHLYWLVSYVRDGAVFWAAIDWDEEAPALRELNDPDAFERALQIVGLA